MTTNFKSNGVDIDTTLINSTSKKSIPIDYRKTDTGYWDDSMGTLWAIGRNSYGTLGQNDIVHRYNAMEMVSPLQSDWDSVAGALSALAIKKDGTLWAWGYNVYGSLGFGDSINRSSPTQVGSLNDWKEVATNSASSYAIKTDGTLWAWGYNYYGQLGNGNYTTTTSPIKIGALTNWKKVVISPAHSAFAIKTDGTLWAWGYNAFGNLGLGNYTHRVSPTQVGTLTNWKQVSSGSNHTLAVKTDGTLWAWGRNYYGQLGVSSLNYFPSPIQIGSSTDWKTVACGDLSSYAIKNDGTLWSWGRNYSGSLGLPDFTHRSSPTQVGTLTSWSTVSGCIASGYTAAAYLLKNDGTLWQIGNNTVSPVEFKTTWKKLQENNLMQGFASNGSGGAFLGITVG